MHNGAVKPRLPALPCLRCQRPTARRRDGRPLCLRCSVTLDEALADKQTRRQGKLKGSRGRT